VKNGRYGEKDFARSGDKATETVKLPAGPLAQFAHSIEPHLRKLGLPTSLQKGIITLLQDYTVCVKGVELSPEAANVLKLLGIAQATFKITLTHAYSEDGGVVDI
jgi:mRNA turnover protein 4